MDVGAWLVPALAIAGCGAWWVVYGRALRAMARMPVVAAGDAPEPARWPRVSVIVAACDEGNTIREAAETLLAEDYPDLEIVLVDDRSRDDTGGEIDRLAERDPRVRAVHVGELPAGWLGKVNALARGVEGASGAWVLFCDADVHLRAGCLRRAVALAEARALDHLPVLPRMRAPGAALEATICAFGLAYLAQVRADALADPRSKAYAGVGAFNLVRADVLARSEGLAWLRMEVADDVGIGLLVKRAGGRTGIALGHGDVEVEWYPSLRAMKRGLEKNLFGVLGHYRLWRAALRGAAMASVTVAPLLAIASGQAVALAIGGGTVALYASGSVVVARRLGQRIGPALLHLAGVPILTYMLCASIRTTLARRGIVWRGTHYSLAALRAGQRVKL